MLQHLFTFTEKKTDVPAETVDTFPFSGQPSKIEYYQCFDDDSNADWITGEEFLKTDWENIEGDYQERKKLWLYFYRPYNYGSNIAPEQKKMIKAIEKDIPFKREQLNWASGLIFISTVMEAALIIFTDFSILHFLPVLIIVLFIIFYYITDIEIVKLSNDLFYLQQEIDNLVQQQRNMLRERLDSNQVDKLFWQDIKYLEKDFIENFLNKNIISEQEENSNCSYYQSTELNSFFSSKNITPPIYPVIPSWGLLQESQYTSGDRQRTTGLELISNNIGNKVATWRQTKGNHLFFRVWFIQFLFFQERALYSVSFFYDFILRKKYGLRKEKYLYNHIAHCAYNEETLSYMIHNPNSQNIGLPNDLTKDIYGNETKTISFSTTSNTTYRCVLPDTDIRESLNSWLKKKKLRHQEKTDLDLNLYTDDDNAFLEDIYYELKNDGLNILPLAMQAFKEIGIRIEDSSLDKNSNS